MTDDELDKLMNELARRCSIGLPVRKDAEDQINRERLPFLYRDRDAREAASAELGRIAREYNETRRGGWVTRLRSFMLRVVAWIRRCLSWRLN